MRLLDYIEDKDRRAKLAATTRKNAGYLWQVAAGWRGKKASPRLAVAIERATDGAVTRHELRPDIFDPPPGGVGPVDAGADAARAA